MSSNEGLKSKALVNRIASIVAEYEDKLVDLRVEATVLVGNLNKRISELEEELNGLRCDEAAKDKEVESDTSD